jgi:DNA helicase HerA-like ATPase
MDKILIGITKNNEKKFLNLPMANRHGLVAGATGTGKTVTLQTIAEQFSRAGVAVFTADVKGDLSGLAAAGLDDPKIKKTLAQLKIAATTGKGCPTLFWDIYGESGHPLRATMSEIGPVLLGRLLNANDIQQGIIDAAFSVADDEGLLLLDLKDIRTLLEWMGDNADTLKTKYGNISKTSIGAIQRGLLAMSEAGGDKFFGEPALKLEDMIQVDPSGNGYVNILDARKLINDPKLYCTFLLWLLSELFEQLPELGDVDKPKLVFFFDEAHLLFSAAPKVLFDKIEQVVRLIRSKGVGVYFVTQSPLDIPESVLGQLGNRVQHALRAFTPKDQKAVKTAAQTFRQNPKLNTEKIIVELGVGEALVSFLDQAGTPNIVEKVQIVPPLSKIGTLSNQERLDLIKKSPIYGHYEQAIDRESAYEIITKKTLLRQQQAQQTVKPQKEARHTTTVTPTTSQILLKTTAKALNSKIGQQIVRGLLGSIFGGKKK